MNSFGPGLVSETCHPEVVVPHLRLGTEYFAKHLPAKVTHLVVGEVNDLEGGAVDYTIG
jgi:hypothetical protein